MFEKHEVRGFFIVLCGIMFPVLIMNILIAVLSANNSDIESKVERPTHILSWFYMPSVNPRAAELSTRSGCDVIRGADNPIVTGIQPRKQVYRWVVRFSDFLTRVVSSFGGLAWLCHQERSLAETFSAC